MYHIDSVQSFIHAFMLFLVWGFKKKTNGNDLSLIKAGNQRTTTEQKHNDNALLGDNFFKYKKEKTFKQ